MKTLKIKMLVFCGLLILGVSLFTQSVLGIPTEPSTYDYAEFRNDPYPAGPNTITIYFYHESYRNMYIHLYNYNDSIVKTWLIDAYTREGSRNYTASYDGLWHVYCKMGSYYYVTDEAYDLFSFNIADPNPNSTQNNLGSDWARHPQDSSIYLQAWSILNYKTNLDAYSAAHLIQAHVFQHYDHMGATDYSFRSDTALLLDLKTKDKYLGVCRSDAVILTAYARSLGIPARILYLGMKHGLEIDPHYFAEFYIPNAPSAYKWITVDGDNNYGWFDQPEANQDISSHWEYRFGWRIGAMKIITSIPYGGIEDNIPPGCSEFYTNWWLYYSNNV